MRDFILPKRTLLLWQLRAFLIGLIFFLACSYYYFNFHPLSILLIAPPLFFIILIFWYLPQFYKSCKLRLTKYGVILRRGVIIQNTHIFPYSRLIYTQTLSTPLAKLFGLRAVTLKAARSRLLVPELLESELERLLTELTKDENR